MKIFVFFLNTDYHLFDVSSELKTSKALRTTL